MAETKVAPKDLEALPMQRIYVTGKITRRKKTKPTEAELEAIRAAKAARASSDPEDDNNGDEDDDEIYDVSLSSADTLDRGYYSETLDHSKDAVDLSRADSGLNLLWNHDPDQPIGRLENIGIKGGKQLTAQMRFFSTPSAQEKKTMVDEGLREMSIGYSIQSYDYTPGTSAAGDSYVATRWTPLEGSLVSIPADHSVGVGRAAGDRSFPVSVRNMSSTTPPTAVPLEVRAMPESNTAAADTAAAQARTATTQIAALCHKHGMSERTAEFLEAGHPVEKVREIIMDAIAARGSAAVVQPHTNAGVDLSEKERRSYSYARAISFAADVAEGKRIKDGGLELEVSDALERNMPQAYKRHGGMFIPTSLRNSGIKELERSVGSVMSDNVRNQILSLIGNRGANGAMDSITANAIKEVVFTEYGGEVIEILRNIALTVSMGARVITGLSSPIAFPRQTGDVVASWVPENPGSDVGASQMATDLVTLNPRTLQATTAYSRQLLVQASVDVEAMTRSSIAASHALAWDKAALHGTGTNNQPLGIYNQPNVPTVDFSSANFSNTGQKIAYTGVVEMERTVAAGNALLGALGFLTTPGIAADAKNTLKFPGASIPQGGVLWDGTLLQGEMDGFVAKATNQVSSTLGTGGVTTPAGTYNGLIFGNWSDVIIGQFGGAMELIVDPYSKKKQGLIEVTSFQMCDVALRHPASFSVGINLSK